MTFNPKQQKQEAPAPNSLTSLSNLPPPIAKPAFNPASNFSGWENEEDEWGLDDIPTSKPGNKFNPDNRNLKNNDHASLYDGNTIQ